MKNANMSKSVAVAAALIASLFVACNRAGALITNLLLDVPYTSNTGFIVENENANPALTYTDGDLATYDFAYDTITYDLLSVTDGVHILGIATREANGWNNPRFVTLNFSDDNFSTISATEVVPLLDSYNQQAAFPAVDARYVQFVMPSGSINFYTDTPNSGFIPVEELELFTPEPASLSLLGVGSLLILRRRRGA